MNVAANGRGPSRVVGSLNIHQKEWLTDNASNLFSLKYLVVACQFHEFPIQ